MKTEEIPNGTNQNLFNALSDICGFTALQDEMSAIIDAVNKDKSEPKEKCPTCKQERIWNSVCSDGFHARKQLNAGEFLYSKGYGTHLDKPEGVEQIKFTRELVKSLMESYANQPKE